MFFKRSFLNRILHKFVEDCRAATAIEYALVAAAIALAIIVIVFLAGDQVVAMFTQVSNALSSYL